MKVNDDTKNFYLVFTGYNFTVSGINYVNAQADPGDPGDDPDRVPLDPGSWVLVAAGVGYGIKKWRDAKNSSSIALNEQPESGNSKDG